MGTIKYEREQFEIHGKLNGFAFKRKLNAFKCF